MSHHFMRMHFVVLAIGLVLINVVMQCEARPYQRHRRHYDSYRVYECDQYPFANRLPIRHPRINPLHRSYHDSSWIPVPPYYSRDHSSMEPASSRYRYTTVLPPSMYESQEVYHQHLPPRPRYRKNRQVMYRTVNYDNAPMSSNVNQALRYVPIVKKVTHHHIHHLVSGRPAPPARHRNVNIAQLSSLLIKSLYNLNSQQKVQSSSPLEPPAEEQSINLFADGSSHKPIKIPSTDFITKPDQPQFDTNSPIKSHSEGDRGRNINEDIIFEDEVGSEQEQIRPLPMVDEELFRIVANPRQDQTDDALESVADIDLQRVQFRTPDESKDDLKTESSDRTLSFSFSPIYAKMPNSSSNYSRLNKKSSPISNLHSKSKSKTLNNTEQQVFKAYYTEPTTSSYIQTSRENRNDNRISTLSPSVAQRRNDDFDSHENESISNMKHKTKSAYIKSLYYTPPNANSKSH